MMMSKIFKNILPQKTSDWVFILLGTLVLCTFLSGDANADFWDGVKKFGNAIKDAVTGLIIGHPVDCPSMALLQERYKDCYSCMTMKVLLEAFMTMGSKTYDISREAGIKLLTIGSIIWIPIFTIKHVSSLTNPEAPSMLNELIKFAFKVIVAYVFITAGISALVNFAINPILAAGADFATTFLSFGLTSPSDGATGLYTYNGPADIIDPAVLDKILLFTEGISQKVATNMILGNGLMCFADQVGFHLWRISVPDIWLWLCGAVIWFVGLLLVMFVSYYLLDIAFKIGFAIIVMPVVIGLWPFKVTSGRLSVCFSIILKASATYAFLALCATFSVILIDSALYVPDENSPSTGSYSGTEQLFAAFADDKVEYVSNLFSITGSTFLIFCICFFYAVKLIGKNQQLVNKFFPDKMFGDVAPMHSAGTMVTDKMKGMAMAPVNMAKDIAVHQTGRAAGGIVKGVMGAATGNAFKGGQKGVGGAAQTAGQATQTAGQAAQTVGQAAQTAGKAAKAAGKGLEAAGKGIEAGGAAVGSLVGLIPGVGAVAGGIVKGATGLAGKTTELAGKVTQLAGSLVEKTGKVVEQTGKAVEKTGKTVEKAGKYTSQMADEGGKNSKEDEKKDKGTDNKDKGTETSNKDKG